MHLNWLTHSDSNLQEKMRYFSDIFLFTNEYLGRLPNIPFDNPISLVNKIIYQIENNIERSPRYIESHFKQLDTIYGEFLEKQYPLFLPVRQYFALYKQTQPKEKKRVAWLKSNPGLVVSLHALELVLEKELFEKIFMHLTSCLQCPHKLRAHKKEIESHTQILVSIFRMKGHSEKQVAGYIDRILSNDRYKFPFPLEIYSHNKDESFDRITEEFLNNRSFQKQFEGLKNLMINQENRTGYFIYAINQVAIDKKLKTTLIVQVDKVTFISPFHTTLKSLRKSVRSVDKEAHFKMYPLFFSKNKLLAYVKTQFEDKSFTRHQASKIVKEELNLLNEYLSFKMSLRDESFLFVEKIGSEHWSGTGSLAKFKLEHLQGIKLEWAKENPFELLRDKEFPGKNQLLHNEKTFIKAIQEENASLFWQYIENLYWFQNGENEDIRSKVVTLLLKNQQRFIANMLLNIGRLFFGLNMSKYSQEVTENKEILAKIGSELGYQHNTSFPIGKYKKFIKHNFLKSVISLYLQTKSKKNSIKWKEYYSDLILELQEFRNAELHSGQGNKYSRIKLRDLIPGVLNQARWLIVNTAIKNKKLSFNDLVEKLST